IDQGGGRIINIASIAGRGFAGTSNAAYAASKGAVISLTKTAAQQLGRHNINVNSVCPGATRTEILTGIFERRVEKEGISMEEVVDSVARTIPIRRLNEPEDVAGVAVFLASPAARNITGQAFNVDGGLVPS
ncbi:MAG: SDR family oxidoreductase, partial [Gammaproteobacteria bacterium]|nr:SDR family oxidoreductase [Gammaproteobacteria bacterium]